MTKEEHRREMAKAAAFVLTWPDWKKNFLDNLSKSTSATPRPVEICDLADRPKTESEQSETKLH